MEINLAELEKVTGVTFKTLKKRLSTLPPIRKTGRDVYYDLKQALELVHQKKSSQLNLETERAKLAAAQTRNLKLTYRQRKGELVNAEEIIEEYSKRVVSAKTKLLALPRKLGANFEGFRNALELEDFAEDIIREALQQLGGDK